MQAKLEAQTAHLADDAPRQDLISRKKPVACDKSEEWQVVHIHRFAHEFPVHDRADALVKKRSLLAIAVLFHHEAAAHDDLEDARVHIAYAAILAVGRNHAVPLG